MARNSDVTKKLPQQLTELLLKIKRVTQESISVAEIAQVTMIDENATIGRYKCELICNPSIVVQAECVAGVTIERGSRVLLIFCDSDFRPALQRIKNDKSAPLVTDTALHSSSYAVIVAKFN